MFETIKKALTVMVLATEVIGKDGHVKKKEKKVSLDETIVKKPST